MYQIDSNKVEEYLNTMESTIEELSSIVESMKSFEEKLVWDSEAGELNKERYKTIMSYEEEVCNILNIFMLIYEKGLSSYGITQEELEKQFEELMIKNNVVDKEVV